MTGNKGLTIAIVALLITLCFGFLANVEETPSTRTAYNDQVNLEPLFYANSSRGSGVEFFNSIYNVTGWENANVPTTSTANQYRLIINDTWTANAPTSYNLNNYTHTTTSFNVANVNNYRWGTSTTGVYYTGGSTYSNGAALNGGTTYRTMEIVSGGSYDFILTYQINGVSTSFNTQVGFKSLNDLITLEDGLKVDNNNYYFNATVTTSHQRTLGNDIYDTINVSGTLYADCDYIVYDEAIDKWRLYDSSDNLITTASNVYVVKSGTMTGTINTYSRDANPPQYVDANELVQINNFTNPADGAKWSNTAYDASLINARVGVLITGKLDIYPNDTDNEAIQIRDDGGTYTIEIDTDVYSIGTYPGVYVIFDAQTNQLTVYGVLSFSEQAPALQYELTPFSYTVPYTFDSTEITAIWFNGQYTGEAYIANTWVYSDPAGVLWNDFNLDLNDYFADRISDYGVRFTINGVSYYGDSLTINGQTFSVIDNKLVYTATVDYILRTYYKPINGLIVDYNDNAVILRFSDGTTYNTGAISDYEIAGAGAWYFSAYLYNIDTVASTEINWSVGWGLDANLTCLIYLGVLGLTFMIASYYGRGSLGGFDYLIMIFAGIIAFVMMV